MLYEVGLHSLKAQSKMSGGSQCSFIKYEH